MRSILAIPLCLAALPLGALADVIHVPADQPTIQAGIDAADDGDTVLVAPGTYTGFGNRDISLRGKAITVKSTDGPEATIIDAQGGPGAVHRGFTLILSETHDSIVDGFTITGGYVIGDTGGTGTAGGGGGGGIFVRDSSPVISNCIITDNRSETLGQVFLSDGLGGGLYVDQNSDTVVKNSVIALNVAGRGGGGVYQRYSGTSLVLVNCLVAHNASGSQYSSGGLYLGTASITNSTIAFNHAGTSGGGVSARGLVSLSDSLVWANTAPPNGSPQVSVSGLPGVTTIVTISHSIVEGGVDDIFVYHSSKLLWTDSLDADPLFLDADRNDFSLAEGSPAIDAGTYPPLPETPPVDLGGNPRIQHCRVDMGAYESPYFADCNGNEDPDACESMKGAAPDCNGNGVPDECDIAGGAEDDCNGNGVPDVSCEADDDGDGVINACDNCALANPGQEDCQGNRVGDACDIADGTSPDCNTNLVPDECDLSTGSSFDELPPDGDGIPDECQFDCNANLNPDLDDIDSGFSRDDNGNSIPDECECAILASNPPSGSIDARQPHAPAGGPLAGWSAVTMVMCPAAPTIIDQGQFVVDSVDGPPPRVTEFRIDRDRVTLVFDAPIPLGAMTHIEHVPSGTHVCLGYLPGDAQGNRKASELDILKLIDHLNGVLSMNIWQCDIDRSGECDPLDILRLIDLLNGAGAYDPWLGEEIAPCP